ncbi:hypothetical protein F7725_027432, partial [Dissostichus mawsoni]
MWLWILISLEIITKLHGYSDGRFPESCVSMLPEHRDRYGILHKPQRTDPPFEITYDPAPHGQPITVYLKSKQSNKFTGFMLEARMTGTEDVGPAVGKFIVLDSRETVLLSCHSSPDNAVSQRLSSEKRLLAEPGTVLMIADSVLVTVKSELPLLITLLINGPRLYHLNKLHKLFRQLPMCCSDLHYFLHSRPHFSWCFEFDNCGKDLDSWLVKVMMAYTVEKKVIVIAVQEILGIGNLSSQSCMGIQMVDSQSRVSLCYLSIEIDTGYCTNPRELTHPLRSHTIPPHMDNLSQWSSTYYCVHFLFLPISLINLQTFFQVYLKSKQSNKFTGFMLEARMTGTEDDNAVSQRLSSEKRLLAVNWTAPQGEQLDYTFRKEISELTIKVCSVIHCIFTTALIFLGVLKFDNCGKDLDSWLVKVMMAYTVEKKVIVIAVQEILGVGNFLEIITKLHGYSDGRFPESCVSMLPEHRDRYGILHKPQRTDPPFEITYDPAPHGQPITGTENIFLKLWSSTYYCVHFLFLPISLINLQTFFQVYLKSKQSNKFTGFMLEARMTGTEDVGPAVGKFIVLDSRETVLLSCHSSPDNAVSQRLSSEKRLLAEPGTVLMIADSVLVTVKSELPLLITLLINGPRLYHLNKEISELTIKVCSVIHCIFTTALIFLGVLEFDNCGKDLDSWLVKVMIAYTVWILLFVIWVYVSSIHRKTILGGSKIGSSKNRKERKKKKLRAAGVIVIAVQ